MKTLILLTTLVGIATAGPTFLGKESIDQDSSLTGVLKTIRRERKSPIQESPSDLFSDVPEITETLPSSDVRSSSAGGLNPGFKKPIIVKKKFGYRIFRDSDEELAQAEPRENCRRQFRFKVCDEGSDQLPSPLRNTQTEDIVESDVEQSLRMAKEAVEILQRDLLKIERNAKLTQKKINTENFEDKTFNDAKELIKQEERLSENVGEFTQWKTSPLKTSKEISQSGETRMSEWKEAKEKIQKDDGIPKFIEEKLKDSEPNTSPSEEARLLISRNADNVDIMKMGTDLLSKLNIFQDKQEKPKSAENMETYATENKDVKVGLPSESLKLEKAASLETSEILRNVENEKNIIDTEPADQLKEVVQGKSAETFLDSSREVKLANIIQGDLSKDLKSEAKLAKSSEIDVSNGVRTTSIENIAENKLKTDTENLQFINENKDVESVQLKAASEEERKEINEVNRREGGMEVKDVEMSESRNSETLLNDNESQTVKENKEKSAMPWNPEFLETAENTMDLKAKNVESQNELLREEQSIQRTANDKSENSNLNVPISATSLEDSQAHTEHKDMREADKTDEQLWNLEPKEDKAQDPIDSLKLREAEEHDDKIIDNNVFQARNIEKEEDSQMSTENKNMRNTIDEEKKPWIVEPSLNNFEDHVDTSKLREAEDTDEKLTLTNNVQARNVINEDADIFENKKTEEKSAVINSQELKFEDSLSKEINREKFLFQKSAETENKEKQKDANQKDLKNLEHPESNKNHNNKQDAAKERNTEDETKNLPFRESKEVHDHLKHNVETGKKNSKPNMPSMKMSEMDYYNDLGNQHTAQLVHDKNIDIHESSHLKDTLSNWNREKYYHNIRDPFMGWPHDRFRTDAQLDPNLSRVHLHNHPQNMHLEEEPQRFFPMGRFVNNFPIENQHELLNNPTMKENMHENGRASEWDIAMEPSMNVDMRHALDKNAMPWGFHRHAGFGSGIPISGAAPVGPGAVGLFPNANAGCGIPLLLSCSPSVVSGSLAKSHSLRYNDPAFRSGDDLRFYTKRDAKITS